MAVLLTGATGFVGRNIAQVLLARGERVVLFAPTATPVPGEAHPLAAFVPGDVRSDEDLRRAFAAGPIDRVVHAAAVTPDASAEADRPDEVIEVNLVGTATLMQAAFRAGVARVLALSSVAAYGSAGAGSDGRLDEDATVPRPLLSPHWQCAEAARAGTECVLPRALAADWIDVDDAANAVADLLAVRDPSTSAGVPSPRWPPGARRSPSCGPASAGASTRPRRPCATAW